MRGACTLNVHLAFPSTAHKLHQRDRHDYVLCPYCQRPNLHQNSEPRLLSTSNHSLKVMRHTESQVYVRWQLTGFWKGQDSGHRRLSAPQQRGYHLHQTVTSWVMRDSGDNPANTFTLRGLMVTMSIGHLPGPHPVRVPIISTTRQSIWKTAANTSQCGSECL